MLVVLVGMKNTDMVQDRLLVKLGLVLDLLLCSRLSQFGRMQECNIPIVEILVDKINTKSNNEHKGGNVVKITKSHVCQDKKKCLVHVVNKRGAYQSSLTTGVWIKM